MKKCILHTAVTTTLLCSTSVAFSDVASFNWEGNFIILDSAGEALINTSIYAKGANQYNTPVSGTMAFDDATGAGIATMASFDYFSGSLPAEATSIKLQAIGDGLGGAGSLVIGNMIFNWNGNYGLPVSVVFDAAGFFGATAGMWGDGVLDQTEVAGFGAVPASDGTYVGATVPGTVIGPGGYGGYLGLGPVPLATTEWNLTNGPGCLAPADFDYTSNVGGGCINNDLSGVLPLVTDTAVNQNELLSVSTPETDGVGIGGVPMWDGPFMGLNPNFDITQLSLIGVDPDGVIDPFCSIGGSVTTNPGCIVPDVPVPAAVWLFGSGLLSLIGFARRR